MPTVQLPDGTQRTVDASLSAQAVAASIGAGLAKAMLAAKIDGVIVDAATTIDRDVDFAVITAQAPEALEILRHSTAHLLAHAVKQLYPEAQVSIGPVIEDGFYYDFAYEPGFSEEDLEKIEARMHELAAESIPIKRILLSRDKAIALFEAMGENYKVAIIRDIPEGESLSLYEQGDFIDLCRGPHVPNTRCLKAFKLMKLAGAYWRGDSKNVMLQRIYGTAWSTQEELKSYLHVLEEAEGRDHRQLAKKMDLFHMQPEAPGMVFWHPKGWSFYQQVKRYIRQAYENNHYEEVHTPQLISRSLLELSGHWGKFGDHGIFTAPTEHCEYAIKPMNCPGHIQIYKSQLRSYRDLPLRLAEFGSCHRNEPSGTLHGLMRLRHFVQDDGHIFCTEEQIQSETLAFIDEVFRVYQDFGFSDIAVKLSTRPEMRVGSDAIWDKAEAGLKQALNQRHIHWELVAGEGAFYGPKIEFSLRDCLKRVWQCGTIQLDFFMPERLEAYYIAEDGTKKVPVMLHRAILGSMERFMGILLENFHGLLPIWLAPIQVAVLTITDAQSSYAEKIVESLKKQSIRVKQDLRNEKIGLKIRKCSIERVPYLLVIGKKEMENNTVTVRTQSGKHLGDMILSVFIERIIGAVNTRAIALEQSD